MTIRPIICALLILTTTLSLSAADLVWDYDYAKGLERITRERHDKSQRHGRACQRILAITAGSQHDEFAVDEQSIVNEQDGNEERDRKDDAKKTRKKKHRKIHK